jgi:hypothetical protein
VTYGTRCARWDAVDEQPWCVVNPGACPDLTFESETGNFWSHAPCNGRGGAPFVPASKDPPRRSQPTGTARSNAACFAKKDQSQWAEGRQVFLWFFNNRRNSARKYYFEIGGLDGKQFSNTFAFEKCLRWRGMLMEPNKLGRKIKENRSPDTNAIVLKAVCDTPGGTVKFATGSVGAVQGRPEFMGEAFKKMFGGMNKVRNVPCDPLSLVFARAGVTHIDFWSLDVEGAELSLLQSVDWAQLTVSVMLVENAEDEKEDKKRKMYRGLQKILRDDAKLVPFARLGPKDAPYKSEVWVTPTLAANYAEKGGVKCLRGVSTRGTNQFGDPWERQCFY